MERISVGIKLDPTIWANVKHRCIDENKEYSEFVEDALRKALNKAPRA